jgi:hypothetical protein
MPKEGLYSRNMQHVYTRIIKMLVIVDVSTDFSCISAWVCSSVPNGFRKGVTLLDWRKVTLVFAARCCVSLYKTRVMKPTSGLRINRHSAK